MLPVTHKIQVWVGHHNGPSARYCPLGKYPKWQQDSRVATFGALLVRANPPLRINESVRALGLSCSCAASRCPFGNLLRTNMPNKAPARMQTNAMRPLGSGCDSIRGAARRLAQDCF